MVTRWQIKTSLFKKLIKWVIILKIPHIFSVGFSRPLLVRILQSSQLRLRWHFVAGRLVPPGLADQRTLCSNFIINVDFLFQRFNGIAFLKRIEAG